MIAIKKITITFIGLLFLVPSYAQERGDLGLIFSTSRFGQLAVEYRKPFAEKYHFRMSAFYGESANSFWGGNGQIISASDSVIVERNFFSYGLQTGLRFGAERQLGNSMFSIASDLSLDYRRSHSIYQNREQYLQENGSWSQQHVTSFSPFDVPTNSRITRHYLVPGARLSLNMNVPLGKCFLLNLSASGTFGLPIYMGASQVQDPEGDFIGTPPSTIDLNTFAGIGIRYIIGSRNKDRG